MGNRPDTPRFIYYLSQVFNPVDKHAPLWDASLPMHRKPENTASQAITYKDYFFAVRSFMENTGVDLIEHFLSQEKTQSVKISEISIFLEKHGEFYHPARIEAKTPDSTVSFVLNVAVSNDGKKCMEHEIELLRRLHRKHGNAHIPKIYGHGEAITAEGCKLNMFLGEWFDGFHEFHLSLHPGGKKRRIRVWTPENENVWLTKFQTRALYRQIALILTHYYDVETYEQILSWHHAAGDFIISLQNNTVNVKLITVRRYAAMVDDSDRDIKSMFEALLVFFLNLSIRIRLDRVDGVGEIVWAGDIALYGMFEGFFDALFEKPSFLFLPAPLKDCFRDYLLSREASELFEYGTAVVEAYGLTSPETGVMQKHLTEHIRMLHRIIQKEPKI
ncbi:hypothetical protein ACFLZM_01530 [Thermodesulfobacteriota bacterium]